jgi:DNA-binding NtrC family response regulator
VNGAPSRKGALVDGDVVEVGSTILVYRDRVRPVRAEVLDLDGSRAETLSAAMDDALEAIDRVAGSLVSIVLAGATGTGKEVLARRLHERSGRSGRFVAVNCAAIPRELVESTLFGHRRGAFSGAVEDRPGFLRAADKGTLFLDEIADLPPPAQAALLRALQEREVVPVGETSPIAVDLRVVAAAQAPLEEVAGFRPDLLARVAGLTVKIPPLAGRREDLGLLVAALLPRVDGKRATFTAEAARGIFRHDWPLNVRELEKRLGAAVALAGGEIDARHLGDGIAPATPGDAADPADPTFVELSALLAEHRGNLSAVARAMNKGRTQIQRWIKRYNLDPESFRR